MKNDNAVTSPGRGRKIRSAIYVLSLALALLQVALVFLSWLLTAAMPDVSMRSLISSGGARWFFGEFVDNLSGPSLVSLVVIFIAWGGLSASGLWQALWSVAYERSSHITSRQRFALRGCGLLFVIEVVVVMLLTLLPHAVLLSVMGELFPGSFSAGLIPTIAFMLVTVSVSYGMLSGRLRGLYDVGQCLCSAGSQLMPLLLLYIFACQLYHSLIYVFVL